MSRYPFTAVVGADDLSLALVLSCIAPEVGGVLVRGEKGTAKSTIVRGLVEVLPPVEVMEGCRFACAPDAPAADCPDGPHDDAASTARPTRLVELPVGAGEDRVAGALDLAEALGQGRAAFHPGLLARAHRGLLYVDEVNLLHDHLVDLLLDASAMGANTVERDGISLTHPARFVLVGTMNPEEGELRPQLLDRFGLSVDVAASREPDVRAEVVQRRLAFDADPAGFRAEYATAQAELAARIRAAREALGAVRLDARTLRTIARVCAGFDVDGMRADIVIARAAAAHAVWQGRTTVEREDVRAAARFALAHRRRRGPFDPPGLDEDLLDRLLDEEDPEPPTDGPDGDEPGDTADEGDTSDEGAGGDGSGAQEGDRQGEAPRQSPDPDASWAQEPSEGPNARDGQDGPPGEQQTEPSGEAPPDATGPARIGLAAAAAPYRTRRFEIRGLGHGAAGRRSQAETTHGRRVGTDPTGAGPVHLPATVRAAATRAATTPATGSTTPGARAGRLRVLPGDLRHARLRGRESNLVLFAVDASGSMAARQRMSAVKTAVLSLLVDAYERRDKVGLVTFAGQDARLVLPPTSSVDLAAARLAEVPHGGRTPLAEGMTTTATTLRSEAVRDPRRRVLVVLVTDGRATSGENALERARAVADAWQSTATETVVVDCESGRFRMHLAADLAARMGATHVPLETVSAHGLLEAVATHRPAGRAA
ncbi:VWA domain-containing protein [Kytococcus sp. Marseille-QA3725]